MNGPYTRLLVKWKNNEEGVVLINVMVFCLLISFLALLLMDVGLLQLKMANNFYAYKQFIKSAEQQLKLEENQLAQSFVPPLKSSTLLQFVPDTLLYNDNHGVNYYSIEINLPNQHGNNYLQQTIFAVRASAPHLSIFNQEKYFFDKLSFPVKSLLSKPLLLKISNNQYVIALLYCSEEKLGATMLGFFALDTGAILKEFKLSEKHTEEFTSLIAVDSHTRGTADYLYLANSEGKLWKININNWQCEQIDLPWPILTQWLMAGRHPKGQGLILYFFTAASSFSSPYLLEAWEDLFDTPFQLNARFNLQVDSFFIPPLLRQRTLILFDGNRVVLYDAYSGQKRAASSLIPGVSTAERQTGSITVVDAKPLERERLVVVEGKGSTKMPVDYPPLGRQSWYILS